MLSLAGFYVCRLVKVKVKNAWVTKFKKVVKHCTQACFLHCFDVLCCLGGPLLVSPLVKQKAFEGFLLSVGCFLLWKTSLGFFGKCYECVLLLGHKGQPQHAWLRGVTQALHGSWPPTS